MKRGPESTTWKRNLRSTFDDCCTHRATHDVLKRVWKNNIGQTWNIYVRNGEKEISTVQQDREEVIKSESHREDSLQIW